MPASSAAGSAKLACTEQLEQVLALFAAAAMRSSGEIGIQGRLRNEVVAAVFSLETDAQFAATSLIGHYDAHESENEPTPDADVNGRW
jgi:hypothetical protein